MHPLRKLLEWFSELDFAVLAHGFAPHGRDYCLHVQDCLGRDPGEHMIEFTHVVRVDYETRVREDVWPRSWTDEFTDYADWEAMGKPDGYVWGTNWSNAYPGISAIEPSQIANGWGQRLGREYFEATVETDRFWLRIVFHDIRHRKLSNNTETISAVIVPLRD